MRFSAIFLDCNYFNFPQYTKTVLNPLNPMSDQERISPHNISTISSRQVMRMKKNINLGDYKLIQYQILQTNIIKTVWQTVKRITNEILGVKGLKLQCKNKRINKKCLYQPPIHLKGNYFHFVAHANMFHLTSLSLQHHNHMSYNLDMGLGAHCCVVASPFL